MQHPSMVSASVPASRFPSRTYKVNLSFTNYFWSLCFTTAIETLTNAGGKGWKGGNWRMLGLNMFKFLKKKLLNKKKYKGLRKGKALCCYGMGCSVRFTDLRGCSSLTPHSSFSVFSLLILKY